MLNVNDYFQVAMRSGKMHFECGGPGAKTYAHIYENYFGAGLSVYQGVGVAAH